MIARLRILVVALGVLLLAGVGYSQVSIPDAEAVITGTQYENFSYSTATGLGTWQIRITINDTFSQHFDILADPPGTIATAVAAPATCATLPTAPPVVCDITFPPGGNTLLLTFTTPYTRLCAAQTVAVGSVGIVKTGSVPIELFLVPSSTTSLVGGVQVPNVVPANTALCPTPIPNTPVPATPTSTPLPQVVVPVIPQVFQHVPAGIFNGSRNNTPTPVRPREVGTAGSTGVGLPPATMPVLRPPSTGDAGLLTLRKVTLGAW